MSAYLDKIRHIISRKTEYTNDGVYRPFHTDDLERPKDLYDRIEEDKKVGRAIGRGLHPGESVHFLKDDYGKEVPVLFDSKADHKLFHNFDPLKQRLIETPSHSFIIRRTKQAVEVDMTKRYQIMQTEHGSVPYMFHQVDLNPAPIIPPKPTPFNKG